MLSYSQYMAVRDRAAGILSADELLRDLQAWGRRELGIRILDVSYDPSYHGKGGLSLAVESNKDFERTGCGKDPAVEEKIAEAWKNCCRDHPDLAPEGFEDAAVAEVCCFREEARAWVLEEVSEAILAIEELPYYHRDLGLMRVRIRKDTVYFFYDRELQNWQGFSHGTNNELRTRVNETVRRRDPAGVFTPEGVPCLFSSIQEVRKDYHGKLENYMTAMEESGKAGHAAERN